MLKLQHSMRIFTAVTQNHGDSRKLRAYGTRP